MTYKHANYGNHIRDRQGTYTTPASSPSGSNGEWFKSTALSRGFRHAGSQVSFFRKSKWGICRQATINFRMKRPRNAFSSFARYEAKVIYLPASTFSGKNKSRTYRHFQNLHTSLTSSINRGILHNLGFRKFEYGRTVECR